MKKLLLMLTLSVSSNIFAKVFIRFEARNGAEQDEIDQLFTDNTMLMYVETAQSKGMKLPKGGNIEMQFEVGKNSELPETYEGKKIEKIRFKGSLKLFPIKDGYTYIFRLKPCAAHEHTIFIEVDKVNFCVQEIKSDEDKGSKEHIKNHSKNHRARANTH